MADLLLAALVPLFGLEAMFAIADRLSPDAYHHQYYIVVDWWGLLSIAAPFLAAAFWSYRKPAFAVHAQVLPAAVFIGLAWVVWYVKFWLPVQPPAA